MKIHKIGQSQNRTTQNIDNVISTKCFCAFETYYCNKCTIHHTFYRAITILVVLATDKKTDVWSRHFMIWKINFGLWAVAWAGQWEKRVWADYEQLLRPVFSLFWGQKIFFWKHHSVRTEKLHWKKVKKNIFNPDKVKKRASKVAHNLPRPFYFTVQPRPQPRIVFSYYEISGPDMCSYLWQKPNS